uniref:Deoxyribonuclease I-like 1-like n=1 Tax=Neolamprologus brichardi TaxID=32507 RepID=A0A3Q4MA56_NEOBR
MLWLWHPPFREQVEDLYSDIETRIEDYLMEMASPRHSGYLYRMYPKTAMKEIDELYAVFKRIYKKWKTDNVIILGDLNAGCSYITTKGWRAMRLRSDPKFHWLIGDEQDTTVREKTHCAYDRIIVHGPEVVSSVVPASAQPFNFKEHFHLTEAEALEVSDHFPVEVDLKANHRYFLRHEL